MSKSIARLSVRLGAVFYVLWGLLHIYAAYLGYEMASAEAPTLIQGKLYQGA